MDALNSGDTAWMLISTGLVVLMIPGLALFYGGMVRVKSVLNMMMMSFGALAIVFVLWIAFGFSMVFGDSVGGNGLIGDIGQFTFLKGLDNSTALIGTIPAAVFIAFQGIFAAITVALISGSIADRAKFGAWMNSLAHAADNLLNVSANTDQSRSRIQDADYAIETTNLARTQIIAQASTAMLAQANNMKQTVLALLD